MEDSTVFSLLTRFPHRSLRMRGSSCSTAAFWTSQLSIKGCVLHMRVVVWLPRQRAWCLCKGRGARLTHVLAALLHPCAQHRRQRLIVTVALLHEAACTRAHAHSSPLSLPVLPQSVSFSRSFYFPPPSFLRLWLFRLRTPLRIQEKHLLTFKYTRGPCHISTRSVTDTCSAPQHMKPSGVSLNMICHCQNDNSYDIEALFWRLVCVNEDSMNESQWF